MVKLNIVDFISCLGLESLIDEVIFSVSYPELLVIKDAPESCVSNEATIALIFILEERFDQKSSMFYVCANSQHAIMKLLLFSLR